MLLILNGIKKEKLNFINIFTDDESWFYINHNEKGTWIIPDEKVVFFENLGFQVKKIMLTVIWE